MELIAELKDYLDGMRRKPLADQLHVAGNCVPATVASSRPRPDFVRALHEPELRLTWVLTQVPRSGDRVHPDAEALAASIAALDLPTRTA